MDKRPTVTKLFDFSGHSQPIYSLQHAGDGYTFFSGGGDGLVVAWDIRHPDAGKVIARIEGTIYSMLYIPELRLLAVGKNNEGIHLIDVNSNSIKASIYVGPYSIFDMVFLNGKILAGTGSGELIEIDIDLKQISRRNKVSDQSLRCLAINKSTGAVAAGFSDNQIRIFEGSDYTCTQQWFAHQNSVFSLSYTPDGKYLLSASRDAQIKQWSVNEHYANIRVIPAHLFAINHLSLSPGYEFFITCSMDKTIKVWSIETLELLRVVDKARHGGHGNSVNRSAWLDSNTFLTAGDDRKISIWKVNKSYI